ncbi:MULTISPECIES: maleylacetoacetate isomerase [Caballeronia]|uniref:Maleylacetoacetate isomerase n=1 Tax=Caballeronia zhejiangensis TaxID=871203 RepID=A0A656QCL8_9BURK|nr:MULTISPECIES: maleylacetoacetate isomerase [Caballeronia]EKS71846.1 maleylacetoacetate isomerase [Burkholderia sp. SJ98]KAK45390.1 maleylacetoacetate isomerase [Caballeronia jiangsuensis]KDR25003.1 maleylacetoacetate isomerase [Caballeronia zhejiangensis]MDR5748149.1 maleylacetoacetate isomerase [Caballeronia sp. LZ029]
MTDSINLEAADSDRVLYTYFRSSAAYRVRIALNLKGLNYCAVPVHLVRGGGQQHQPEYRAVNPVGLVPSYRENGRTIRQSLAIIEYLDECHSEPPLLPDTPFARAQVRELALSIACEIHPLNNPRVLKYLEREIHTDEAARLAWMRHWMKVGLEGLETLLADRGSSGRFCHGDQPTIADCCLVPQLFNARRFEVDLSNCPRLLAIAAACNALAPFQDAHPSRQPDAET